MNPDCAVAVAMLAGSVLTLIGVPVWAVSAAATRDRDPFADTVSRQESER